MAINGIERFSQQVHQLKAESKPSDGPLGQKISEAAHLKKMNNAAILEANASVSLKSGNNALSLVYKAALEEINNLIKETTGEENAVQSATDAGMDFSPEATAQRILSFATGFFDKFKENHSELEDEEARSQFVDLIQGGIDRGFEEAREILDGLQVLNGDIADNIDKTYQFILDGLNQFLNPDSEAEGEDSRASE